MNNRYFIRAVKYLIWLTVLFVLLYAFMIFTGTARSGMGAWNEILATRRGIIMLIAIVLLAAAYPTFGFVRRTANAGIEKDRDSILRAFRESGFSLAWEDGGNMVFKASTPLKKVVTLWEDTIKVTADGEDRIVLEGIRNETVRIQFRLSSYIG